MRSSVRRIARASLAAGESLMVSDGESTTVRIDRGCVWVTEEGSCIDHILVPGQRYTFDRPGVAIVTAHEDARVTLVAPRRVVPGRVSVGGRTVYVRSLWETVVRAFTPAASPA